MVRRRLFKKAEKPSTGAPFLIVLTLMMVFYIIFLPPDQRAALLNEGTVNTGGNPTGSTGSSGVNPTEVEFVFEGPGAVTERTRNEYDHDISPFYLKGEFEARVLGDSNDFLVRSTLFQTKSHTFEFTIENVNEMKNPVMSFNARKANGILTVILNGREIFSGELEQFNNAFQLDPQLLAGQNTVSFVVDSPGLAFWSSHLYEIENLRVIADVIDTGELDATHVIDIRAVEVQDLQSARLRFLPDCQSDVGKMKIYINNQMIFDKVPDCQVLNVVSVPRDVLVAGQNFVQFSVEEGTFLMDQIKLLTRLDDDDGLTYYFDLDEDLFTFTADTEYVCGEIDGVCPTNCNNDVDKDCCFESYTNGYWCDVPTSLLSDRCVGNVDVFNINRCPSGYEDSSGDVPDDFEGICGDDDDNVCPSGCSQYYDEDCCLVEDSGNYWCDDLPIGGVANICLTEMTDDVCPLCPTRYDGEDRSPTCSADSRNVVDDEAQLRDIYEVTVEFIFVDDGKRHAGEVNVNGHRFSFDTRDESFKRDISRYVVDYTNYIQIIPRSDYSLVQTRVDIE